MIAIANHVPYINNSYSHHVSTLQESDTEVKKNIWGKIWDAIPGVFEPYDFQDTVEDKYNTYSYFTAIFTEARENRFVCVFVCY